MVDQHTLGPRNGNRRQGTYLLARPDANLCRGWELTAVVPSKPQLNCCHIVLMMTSKILPFFSSRPVFRAIPRRTERWLFYSTLLAALCVPPAFKCRRHFVPRLHLCCWWAATLHTPRTRRPRRRDGDLNPHANRGELDSCYVCV